MVTEATVGPSLSSPAEPFLPVFRDRSLRFVPRPSSLSYTTVEGLDRGRPGHGRKTFRSQPSLGVFYWNIDPREDRTQHPVAPPVGGISERQTRRVRHVGDLQKELRPRRNGRGREVGLRTVRTSENQVYYINKRIAFPF